MMTVKELRESLEAYGDHLKIMVSIDDELGTKEFVDTISTEEDKELGTHVVIYTAPDDDDETEVDDGEEDEENEVKDD